MSILVTIIADLINIFHKNIKISQDDELYKYYGYLKVLDNTDNVQKSNEDNGKINRLQKELEQEKAYCKFWKELTLNLKSSFEGLINKIEEGDINIDKNN